MVSSAVSSESVFSSSYISTLSILFAPRFLVAIVGSLPKNSSPSTKTLFTSLPWELMLPFLSTSTPGSFLSKSSTTALAFVLKESAKKTKVSPLKKTGSL